MPPFKPRRLPILPRRQNLKPRADHGPPERWQHSGRTLELTEQAGTLAARATEEHVVDALITRGLLEEREREAAMKFKLDYQCAGLEARLCGRYSPIRSARDFFAYGNERTDAEEAAYQRWRNAVRVLGAALADNVISIVCHDRVPAAAGLLCLQAGLKKLADWYGMPEADQRQESSDQNIQEAAARQAAGSGGG